MAEDKVVTTSTSSDGTVTIAVEKYHELLAKAAEKPPVINRTTIQRTPEIQAKDHVAWGITFIVFGAISVGIGTTRLSAGLRTLRALKST